MFKYYLKTAFRYLSRFKSISIINITGLTIGITVCILLLLYVQDELSFDNFHEDPDNIYPIVRENPYVAPQIAKLVKDNFPEVIEVTRILPRDDISVKYGERKYKEKNFALVDPGFFNKKFAWHLLSSKRTKEDFDED